MNEFIIISALVIIIGGFWVLQARKYLRKDTSKAILWLGPVGGSVFHSLMKQSPQKQDSYVLAIGIGNIVVVLLLLALLTWL